MTFIIAQIIGGINTVIAVCDAQFKSVRNILIANICMNILSALNYLLLGGISGTVMCLIAISLCIVSYCYTLKERDIPAFWVSLYIIIYLISLLATYKGIEDIFSFLGAFFCVIALTRKTAAGYRKYGLGNCISWIVYSICTKAYTAIGTYALLIVSILYAVFRQDLKKTH